LRNFRKRNRSFPLFLRQRSLKLLRRIFLSVFRLLLTSALLFSVFRRQHILVQLFFLLIIRTSIFFSLGFNRFIRFIRWMRLFWLVFIAKVWTILELAEWLFHIILMLIYKIDLFLTALQFFGNVVSDVTIVFSFF